MEFPFEGLRAVWFLAEVVQSCLGWFLTERQRETFMAF